MNRDEVRSARREIEETLDATPGAWPWLPQLSRWIDILIAIEAMAS